MAQPGPGRLGRLTTIGNDWHNPCHRLALAVSQVCGCGAHGRWPPYNDWQRLAQPRRGPGRAAGQLPAARPGKPGKTAFGLVFARPRGACYNPTAEKPRTAADEQG